MPFFPPRAPSWSPKPRKKQSFLTLPPKGPKHCKKRCFLTPQAKDTVNYRSFSRPGVVWGCVGGGSAAGGGAAPITFGHHRRPPARTRPAWPAPRFKGLRLTAARRPSNLGTGLALWPYVGLCWACVGPMLAHVELSWEPCWGHLC